MTPLVVVMSSPSGGGKSSITRQVLAERRDVGYSVSATTRPARTGEEDGKAYHFLTPEEFERRGAAGDFLEDATYNGYRYGTLVSEVRRVTQGGKHVILDIEIEGARRVRQRFPDALMVFVVPPSGAVLVERLRVRGTESAQAIAGRMQRALTELEAALEYDYIVVNDDLEGAVRVVNAILDAEPHRTNRQRDAAFLLERIRNDISAELTRSAGTT